MSYLIWTFKQKRKSIGTIDDETENNCYIQTSHVSSEFGRFIIFFRQSYGSRPQFKWNKHSRKHWFFLKCISHKPVAIYLQCKAWKLQRYCKSKNSCPCHYYKYLYIYIDTIYIDEASWTHVICKAWIYCLRYVQEILPNSIHSKYLSSI